MKLEQLKKIPQSRSVQRVQDNLGQLLTAIESTTYPGSEGDGNIRPGERSGGNVGAAIGRAADMTNGRNQRAGGH